MTRTRDDLSKKECKKEAKPLIRKLSDFQAYYNAERVHASLAGNAPLGVAAGEIVKRAEVDDVRWASHCHGLV